MPLSKAIMTEFGLEAGHWRVARREFDDILKQTEVTLYGYPSKAAFQAGAQCMAFKKLTLPYDTTKGLNVRQMEDFIIANASDFAGGTADTTE